jgi:diguanylate cyclase (GGDEF)-like protein
MSKAFKGSARTSLAPKLNGVVVQSEKIKGVVSECASELSSVNSTLEQTLSDGPSQPSVESALEQSQAVEAKVQICADDLTHVNLALKQEIRERRTLEQALESAHQETAETRRAALHDPLTSLPNRSLFQDRLGHGLAQAKRHGWTLAVMFIDLDGFKSINDLHGHMVGDQVLQTVALRLKNMTRADDTVSRQGGDEFLYLLMELNAESDASRIAEKLIARIAEPFEVKANAELIAVSIRCSIGISLFPRNGCTGASLIASADKAMYQAKRAGGGYAYDLDVLEPPSQ